VVLDDFVPADHMCRVIDAFVEKLVVSELGFERASVFAEAIVRALPWVKVEKSYTFTSPEGHLMLADLFKQHSQLFIKHVMMEP
jgi:predicted dithiol-disulfide oxidoreductase (DUF899 family)